MDLPVDEEPASQITLVNKLTSYSITCDIGAVSVFFFKLCTVFSQCQLILAAHMKLAKLCVNLQSENNVNLRGFMFITVTNWSIFQCSCKLDCICSRHGAVARSSV